MAFFLFLLGGLSTITNPSAATKNMAVSKDRTSGLGKCPDNNTGRLRYAVWRWVQHILGSLVSPVCNNPTC